MFFLRVCGAYTYRLTRKHLTTCIITVLVVFILTILHLYNQKQRYRYRSKHIVGDFDYKPGAFLKDIQPNENISYCQFNYGLPYDLKVDSSLVYPSPEMGTNSPFKVIYNAIKATAYENASGSDAVTYATHCTPEFIYHIVEIARFWDGPISLSVFVPDYDLDITMQIMKQLCHCYPNMAKVSMHLFYHSKYPPKMVRDPFVQTTPSPSLMNNITMEEILSKKRESYKNLTNATRAEYIQKAIKKKIQSMMVKLYQKRNAAPYLIFPDCSGLESFDIPTFRRESNAVYPVNVGRNAARIASKTDYFLVSDIEMVPSDGLAPKFLAMIKKLTNARKQEFDGIVPKTVFVVPLFEVERGEEIPRDKDTLRALVEDSRAMYFHQKICVHCQRFPGLQRWLSKPAPEGIEPLLIARREYPYHRWEPIYLGTRKEPWYNEMLSWEGQQDKMTQMLELCLQGYRMVILDGAFLCHAARTPQDRSRYRIAEMTNNKHYESIIGLLKLQYQDRPQCKVDWGFKVT